MGPIEKFIIVMDGGICVESQVIMLMPPQKCVVHPFGHILVSIVHTKVEGCDAVQVTGLDMDAIMPAFTVSLHMLESIVMFCDFAKLPNAKIAVAKSKIVFFMVFFDLISFIFSDKMC